MQRQERSTGIHPLYTISNYNRYHNKYYRLTEGYVIHVRWSSVITSHSCLHHEEAAVVGLPWVAVFGVSGVLGDCKAGREIIRVMANWAPHKPHHKGTRRYGRWMVTPTQTTRKHSSRMHPLRRKKAIVLCDLRKWWFSQQRLPEKNVVLKVSLAQ